MILETNNKTVEVVLKTRKIVRVANLLKVKSFEDVFFKAIQEKDIETLSKMLLIFCEIDGKECFKNASDVQDFIDDYKKEKNKSYNDIFNELAEVINEEGFFIKKMTKEEMKEMISSPLSGINTQELVQKSAEKAITKIAEEQFNGFQA